MRVLNRMLVGLPVVVAVVVVVVSLAIFRATPDPLAPPYPDLLIADIFFSLAVVFVCTGKALARFGGVVYRAKEPKQFWWIVAICYFGGIFFIGRFLYRLG
jgi:ABC-type spermidine/putrescine transport system permease subunit II